MKFNLISDYFEMKSGSKCWPSSDPADSPFDKYTCKLCGWSFSKVMHGYFMQGHDPFTELKETMRDHILVAHTKGFGENEITEGIREVINDKS